MKFFFVLFATFFLCAATFVSARELADPKSKCSVTVPNNWTLIPIPANQNYAAAASNPKGNESISFFTRPYPGFVLDENDPYVQSFIDSTQKQGALVLRKERRTLNGRDFYVITCLRHGPSTDMRVAVWLTIANGQLYQIGLTAFDPGKAPDLQAALKSFHFLK